MGRGCSPGGYLRAGLEGYHPRARGDARLVTSHGPGSNVSVGAVGMLAGHEIRRRWRSTIAIVLLIGVFGAIVLATAAPAQRHRAQSFSIPSAAHRRSRSPWVLPPQRSSRSSATPGSWRSPPAWILVLGRGAPLPGLAIAAPLGPAMGKVVDRSRLIAGRRADHPPHEVVIGESLAERLRWRVGHHINTRRTQPVARVRRRRPWAPAAPMCHSASWGSAATLDLGVRSISGGVIVLRPRFTKTKGQIGWYTDVLRVRTRSAGRRRPVSGRPRDRSGARNQSSAASRSASRPRARAARSTC